MNCAELPIQQMAEAAGKVIFGDMFSAPKDDDPKWVKQTWERVVAAIESALIYFPDTAMDKLTRCRIREAALSEAANWHQGEAERKRVCPEKNRTLRAQISTHVASEAAIRSLAANVSAMVSEPSPRAQALEEAARVAETTWPDSGPLDMGHGARIAAAIRALSSQPVADRCADKPSVKGIVATHFGDSFQFSGVNGNGLILVSVRGDRGLVPIKYLLPHQLYVRDVQTLNEEGEVLVCEVPIYSQQINVSAALPDSPGASE